MKYTYDSNYGWSRFGWWAVLVMVIIVAGYVIGSVLLEALVPIYQLVEVLGG